MFFKCQKLRLFITTKPRDHAKSIGHRILLLARGLKPQTDLLQGPNMKFVFCCGIHVINSVLLVARTAIFQGLSGNLIRAGALS